MNNIVCPISTETIKLSVSRLTVFINVILMGLFFYTDNLIFPMIVFVDYFIRAFLPVKFSPIRFISLEIIKVFRIRSKNINLAQKIFASRLGMLCALACIIFFYFGNMTGAYISLGLLMVLSFADSVFNFCVGCLIYNYLVYPFYKDK